MNSNAFSDTVLEVSDFVAVVNQTIEYAYPNVTIRGELANFKISKNKWVYFDLQDETAKVRFFGSVYVLSSPLEDGMLLQVKGVPRLHPQFGFTITILSIRPEGEGTIRRAAELLKAKLQTEGLFDQIRKRVLPYPPSRIGLITSTESAAYADFLKVLNARWHGVAVECINVQVQGEAAPEQIVQAFHYFNEAAFLPDVVVVIRGGGSAEDLQAFNTEQVTRAVATSRVPTMVAIGHEIDISLAELAADQRGSTPSNAAELLVPDRANVEHVLTQLSARLQESIQVTIQVHQDILLRFEAGLSQALHNHVESSKAQITAYDGLLEALSPKNIVRRGYAIVRLNGNTLVRRKSDVRVGDIVNIEISNGEIDAIIQ